MKRKLIAAAIATVLAGGAPFAMAQQGKLSGDAVKIGVLTDMSGLYADYGGPGAVAAARLAVQDFGGKMFGKPIAATQLQQERLAEMMSEITKAQLLVLQLGRLKDEGKATPSQVSLAKRNNVNMACECAREARRLLRAPAR